MFRQIRIALVVPVVLPLLEALRARAQTLAESTSTLTPAKRAQVAASLSEVQALLDAFHPDFPNTGEFVVGPDDDRGALLRACSFLRLDLRQNALAELPDEVIEAGELDLERCDPERKQPRLCYVFLATLQELILRHFGLSTGRPPGVGVISGWWRRIRGAFGGGGEVDFSSTHALETLEAWQVVVLNDPVNLMSYVEAVFRHVLGLPQAVAHKRMREVHENKRSILWQGTHAQVESCAADLRAWHLNAIAERVSPKLGAD